MLGLFRKLVHALYSTVPSRMRQIVTIFLALVLAIVLWVLVTLNQPNQLTLNFPIEVRDVPVEVQLTELSPTSLQVKTEGLGLDLVLASVKARRDTIFINYESEFATEGYIPTTLLQTQVTNYFKTGVSVLAITPEQINSSVEFKVSKRVPLRFSTPLNLPPAYRLTHPVVLSQDSVTILGPQDYLDSLTYWETAPVEVAPILEPTEIAIPILDTAAGLVVSPKVVQAYVNPRKYTQTTLTYQLKITQIPPQRAVRLSSQTLKIACLVPIEEFELLTNTYANATLEIPFDSLKPRFPFIVPELTLPPSIRLVYRDPLEISYVIIQQAQTGS